MLGQNLKENHRIKFELVVEQVNITCTDINKTSDINNICLQLFYHGSSGKEAIETECITSSKRVSLTGLQYVLTWKHHQILKFSVTLSKRKGTYDKAKKPPELFLSQVDPYRNNPEKLGSAKLDLHEHANKKVTGQTYEHDDKISINLRNNKKILSCELMVKYRIPDTDPSVIDTSSIHSSVMTPSVSIETINSLDTRAFSHRTLETPIYKLLNEIHLIGLDGNLYSAEWSKMRLIFFVFGTMPDFMRNLKDLIQTLQADRTIGLYVEVVHICQGELSERDVRYPYLPRSDYQNPTFHHIFNIQEPHPDHPKICVVNEKMTEYYVVEAYQIEKYVEERNPLELYYLWNNKKPPLDLKPQRSVSLHDDIPRQQHRMVPKSNSLVNIHGNHNNHYRSSSYDGSSPSSRSSIKAVKVTESLEYKTLEAELSSTTDSLNQLRETLQSIQMEMTSKQQHNTLLKSELERIRMMEHESQKVLEKCQKENIFFRHQVMLRGNLALRSGTFNLFKTRWFQLESMSSHTISPVISFYSGPDRLGQIVLAEVVTYEVVTDTQFRLSTRFATYVLNAENGDEAQKWLSGIENLKHTFLSDFSNGDG
ncbi:uncharacterized protein LOC134816703 isoform X2 [Bolinopsis microptera]|uniref:uncharacterized protein LOC134816703 isoform X2 n=1 Tax=Bolinopsis microptera TaxID=2820187 RepID=UPI003079A57A